MEEIKMAAPCKSPGEGQWMFAREMFSIYRLQAGRLLK